MLWSIVVEGDSDLPVVEAILRSQHREIGQRYVLRGKDRLDARLEGFMQAATFSPFLVVRDLDQDADCAPTLANRLRAGRSAPYVRIAVRAVESWLLADHERAAEWLGVSRALVPEEPEAIPRPKQALLDLARQSRRREIRESVPPADPSLVRVGPGCARRSRASTSRCR